MTESGARDDRKRREDSPEVRLLLRLLLGLFGGPFIGAVSFVLLSYSEVAALLGFVFGALAVAFGAFARTRWLRVLAWAVAGAGFGDALLAVIAGGLGVGTVLTPSGMVMALVGAVLGYRTVPPKKETNRPPSERGPH